jgi:Tol biopolymer transport system component
VNKTATSTEVVASISGSGAAFVPNSALDAVAFRNIQQSGIAPLEVAHHDGSGWHAATLTNKPALFFYWSPDGSKLLYATLEDGTGGPWLHWNVWDGQKTVTFGRFQPSAEFATNYIPFFTQYAQSMTPWAPDGSAFAYPGNDEAGHTGIWVQPAQDSTVDPTLVATGDVVTWSPT